jgi:hypothetical protein
MANAQAIVAQLGAQRLNPIFTRSTDSGVFSRPSDQFARAFAPSQVYSTVQPGGIGAVGSTDAWASEAERQYVRPPFIGPQQPMEEKERRADGHQYINLRGVGYRFKGDSMFPVPEQYQHVFQKRSEAGARLAREGATGEQIVRSYQQQLEMQWPHSEVARMLKRAVDAPTGKPYGDIVGQHLMNIEEINCFLLQQEVDGFLANQTIDDNRNRYKAESQTKRTPAAAQNTFAYQGVALESDVTDALGFAAKPTLAVKTGVDTTAVTTVWYGRTHCYDYADGAGTLIGNHVYFVWKRKRYAKESKVEFQFRTNKNRIDSMTDNYTVDLSYVKEDLYPVQLHVVQMPQDIDTFYWSQNKTYDNQMMYDAKVQRVGLISYDLQGQVKGRPPNYRSPAFHETMSMDSDAEAPTHPPLGHFDRPIVLQLLPSV